MVAARVVMPIVVVLVAAAGLAAAQDDPSLAAQYERKMEVFNATLAAATAYTQAFEDLQAYAAIAREAGGVLRPGFGAKLEEFRARLEKAADTRAFKGVGTAATVQEHVAGAVALVSEIDGILKDPNLPPAAKRSLTALRGAGEALSLLGGNVPVLGEGLKAYGDVLKELTRTVHAAAANVEALKGGTLSSAEERALGGLPTATRLYEKAPAWALGLPVVSDVESGATFLRAPDGAWRPVDGDEVARIAAEWKYVRGSAPAPKDVVEYLDSPAERARLAAQAQTRARVELNQRLMADLGVSGMEHRDFIRVKYALETRLEGLGLGMSPRSPAFRRLLGGELTRPGGDDAMLPPMALDAPPGARAFLRWLGLDPDRLTLDELTQRLRQYRTGDYRRFARAQPARPGPGPAGAPAPPGGGPPPPPARPPRGGPGRGGGGGGNRGPGGAGRGQAGAAAHRARLPARQGGGAPARRRRRAVQPGSTVLPPVHGRRHFGERRLRRARGAARVPVRALAPHPRRRAVHDPHAHRPPAPPPRRVRLQVHPDAGRRVGAREVPLDGARDERPGGVALRGRARRRRGGHRPCGAHAGRDLPPRGRREGDRRAEDRGGRADHGGAPPGSGGPESGRRSRSRVPGPLGVRARREVAPAAARP